MEVTRLSSYSNAWITIQTVSKWDISTSRSSHLRPLSRISLSQGFNVWMRMLNPMQLLPFRWQPPARRPQPPSPSSTTWTTLLTTMVILNQSLAKSAEEAVCRLPLLFMAWEDLASRNSSHSPPRLKRLIRIRTMVSSLNSSKSRMDLLLALKLYLRKRARRTELSSMTRSTPFTTWRTQRVTTMTKRLLSTRSKPLTY